MLLQQDPSYAGCMDRVPLSRGDIPIISPLRYPGSKRRLASYIAKMLRMNSLHPELFVEPFAGGASVALQLLKSGLVDRIGLIEIDPLVASFWRMVFYDTDRLIDWVNTVEVSVANWKRFKSGNPRSCRSMAFTCLFLNRTSFSGILAPCAGPIGGKQQCSDYKVDCRFPRETLARRIRQAGDLREQVAFVYNTSWDDGLELIAAAQKSGSLPTGVCYYFDPPFFHKAERLYTYYFNQKDHERLRDTILSLKHPWILSYDSASDVMDLYKDSIQDAAEVHMLYGTSGGGGNRIATETLLTSLPELPVETRLWRKNSEWSNARKNGMILSQDS